MDLARLRERVIDEVMRQLGAPPGAPGAPAATPGPAAAAGAAPPAEPAAGEIPPATLASARLARLQKKSTAAPEWPQPQVPAPPAPLEQLQATCAVDPGRAAPRRVDVLVVLVGRDEVGDGLAEARALIQQGYSAALVTSPELLARTGPGLIYEVMAGGPVICGGDEDLARQLAAAARVVLVPALSLAAAADVVALQARDFAAQVLVAAISQGKPVIAARNAVAVPGSAPALGLRRKVEEYLQVLKGYGVVLGDAARLSEVAAGYLQAGTAAPPATRPATGAETPPAFPGRRNLPADDPPIKPSPAVTALLERLRAQEPAHPATGAGDPAPNTGDPALAAYIDHTLLRPEATADQIRRLCTEAREYGFAAVCVHPIWVALCAEMLRGTPTQVATVIGFPHGATCSSTKAAEARTAVAQGATELDMVIPIGLLKSGQDDAVRRDIQAVVEAAAGRARVKVIIETGLLTDAEKGKACRLAKEAGAHFVKTATGFGPGGATVADVRLMRAAAGPDMGIKAAGGIRDVATARALIAAGATRIGTSAGVAIVTGKAPS